MQFIYPHVRRPSYRVVALDIFLVAIVVDGGDAGHCGVCECWLRLHGMSGLRTPQKSWQWHRADSGTSRSIHHVVFPARRSEAPPVDGRGLEK